MPQLQSPASAAPLAVAEETRVFHTLDALRGLAAICVVMFHMQPAFQPLAVPGGHLAVDLFFIMSGVVLSRAYEGRFQAGMGTLGFMRVRLIRLYPLYLLGAVFGIAVTLASMLGRNINDWDASSLAQASLRALLFLPNVTASHGDQLYPLNIPSWSLFFEIAVNLLFVALWPLLTSRRLVVIAAATGTGVCAAVFFKGDLDIGAAASHLLPGLARTIFGFSVGVLIARHFRPAPRGAGNLQVIAILAIIALSITLRPGEGVRPYWDLLCALVVFPLVVCWATFVDPGTWLRRVATFLGVTSYAVYVLHSPLSSVLNSVTRAVQARGFVLGAPWLGLLVLAALLVGCWFVDRYYDAPVRKALGRIIPRTGDVRRARRVSGAQEQG